MGAFRSLTVKACLSTFLCISDDPAFLREKMVSSLDSRHRKNIYFQLKLGRTQQFWNNLLSLRYLLHTSPLFISGDRKPKCEIIARDFFRQGLYPGTTLAPDISKYKRGSSSPLAIYFYPSSLIYPARFIH